MREIGKFKAWCRRVLPAVYDDSLSYYEQLAKIVAKLNEAIDSINEIGSGFDELKTLYTELKNYVDHYFDNLDVQSEINNKLDAMAANGTLDEIINQHIFNELNNRINELTSTTDGLETAVYNLNNPSIENSIQSYSGFNTGFNVAKSKKYVKQYFVHNVHPELDYTTDSGVSISKIITLNLDYPVTYPVVTGTTDKYIMWVVNAYGVGAGKIAFRLASTYPFDSAHRDCLLNISVDGTHSKPPLNPVQPIGINRMQAVAVARSYVTARENGRKFAYGANFIYTNSDVVNNANGDAMMECDTLVFMTLTGIPYAQSPYNNTAPNSAYDFNNLVVNPLNYNWALTNMKNDESYGGRITNASTINWLMWNSNFVYRDVSQLQSGDVAIFRRTSAGTFDNVGHVGIIEMVEENGAYVPYLIHVSVDAYSHGNIVDRTPLSEFYKVSAGRYVAENTYFARPNYNV